MTLSTRRPVPGPSDVTEAPDEQGSPLEHLDLGRRRDEVTQDSIKLRMLAPAWIVMIAYTFAAATALIEPHSLTIDRSLPRTQVDSQVIAARRYDTSWNTGDEALARGALAPNFVDSTLPVGRPQGLDGPLAASKLLRAAIPDLSCEIEQMIVAGDRVVTHLRFRSHFTGHFGQIQGHGQTINVSPPILTGSPTHASLRIGTSRTIQPCRSNSLLSKENHCQSWIIAYQQ